MSSGCVASAGVRPTSSSRVRPSVLQSASLTSSQRQSALMIAIPIGESTKPRRKRSSLARRSAPRWRANSPSATLPQMTTIQRPAIASATTVSASPATSVASTAA